MRCSAVDVGLSADPRGEPLMFGALIPSTESDLVPRLAQLLLVLLQLVFGRRENERRPGQACQTNAATDPADSTGAGRAGPWCAGSTSRQLERTRVRHDNRAWPRPRPSDRPRTAAEHPRRHPCLADWPRLHLHHGGVYTPTPMRRLLPRLHGPVRYGAIVLAMAAPLVLVSLTAPLAPGEGDPAAPSGPEGISSTISSSSFRRTARSITTSAPIRAPTGSTSGGASPPTACRTRSWTGCPAGITPPPTCSRVDPTTELHPSPISRGER
jgi:hypothetical protein